MEIISKNLRSQKFNVQTNSGEYTIYGLVTLSNENEIISVENATIAKNGYNVAEFNIYSNSLNITYVEDIDVDEQQKILNEISEFKQIVKNNNI